MRKSLTVNSHNVYRIYAGSGELSPFHHCYATEEVVLRIAAGRFYVHDNGDDHGAAYWHLRKHAVIYDVPERPVEISGPDAVAFLEMIFARKIADLAVGRGRYAIACTHKGGIFMDGILFKLSDDRFWYVQPDGALDTWLLAHQHHYDVTVSDPHSRVLQIQGPASLHVMEAASDGAINSSMRYFHSGFFQLGGQEVYVSRTGWTGELGFEIYTQGDETDCPRLWDHLMQIGAQHKLLFSSLQSMNTRRIEAGILDCGSDFDTTMTPFEAGLGRFIDLDKGDFIGKQTLQNAQTGSRIFGVKCSGATPRAGFAVIENQKQVGYVTTGAYSPYLQSGIGYVRFDSVQNWSGKNLCLRPLENELIDCEVIDLPFYDADKKIPRGLAAEEWT